MKKPIRYSKRKFYAEHFEKKNFFWISKNHKGHTTLKIFSRAISNHLISFRFLSFSGHFPTVPEHQNHSGSREIWFNQRKKNRAHTSKGNDLRVNPKKSLFCYITASREGPLTWGVHLLSAPPHQQHSQIVKDYIKKIPTFIAFLKLFLGDVKVEIMLILCYFWVVF